MSSNKEKENDFYKLINGHQYSKKIIVDKNGKGDFTSIQKAVDEAEAFTTISINEGIYNENVVINKPFLNIESSNSDKQAIIVSSNTPCFKIINLQDNDSIRIADLKMTNRGIVDMINSGNNNIADKSGIIEEDNKGLDVTKRMIYSNSHIIENLEINYSLDVNLIEGVVAENRGRLSIITVLGGVLSISNCQLSLGYLSTSTDLILPAIYAENSVTFIESTYIKGNKEYLTIGMLAYNSNVKLVNCIFHNHRTGGILSHITENNKIDISKTKFSENTGCGIFIRGVGEVFLHDNLVEKNFGIGIHILESKRLSLIGNKIIENLLDGAYLVNCEGTAMLNNLYKNKGSGFVTEANENKFFLVKIMKNTIAENIRQGIIIKGLNNNALIYNNERICYNNLSGIQISDRAHPSIKENKIFENMSQGILIISESSAAIELNEIYKNIKANIAFGGYNTEMTSILSNKIYGSRSEGIYIIKATGGKVERNEIYDNNDGIITVSCKNTEIKYNNIYNNIRTGAILSDKSIIVLENNNIHDNQFLGLFMRDESGGRILNNDLNLNISQLYLSNDCKSQLSEIKKRNNVLGRIDVPQQCNIL